MIIKWEELGLCPCLVLDMYFSMVDLFPIYNANFLPNFFFLCLKNYLLSMSIISILVLSYPLSLCISTWANFPLNCHPGFKEKVAIICSTFGHRLHFRQSFRIRKHFLFCSTALQLLDLFLLLGAMTNPPLAVRSMGPEMDTEDTGTPFSCKTPGAKTCRGKCWTAGKWNFIFRIAIYLQYCRACMVHLWTGIQ